jgi:hypothetical protein
LDIVKLSSFDFVATRKVYRGPVVHLDYGVCRPVDPMTIPSSFALRLALFRTQQQQSVKMMVKMTKKITPAPIQIPMVLLLLKGEQRFQL